MSTAADCSCEKIWYVEVAFAAWGLSDANCLISQLQGSVAGRRTVAQLQEVEMSRTCWQHSQKHDSTLETTIVSPAQKE